MIDFKKGDKIIRVGKDYGKVKNGKIYTFEKYPLGGKTVLYLVGLTDTYDADKFELAEPVENYQIY